MSQRLKFTATKMILIIIIMMIFIIWLILSFQFEDFNLGTSSLGITNIQPISHENLSIPAHITNYSHGYRNTQQIVYYNTNPPNLRQTQKDSINTYTGTPLNQFNQTIPTAKAALIAYGGDGAAGYATNYYTYTINFILYAQSLNMEISIIYNSKYNHKYFDSSIGKNSFNYWFEPILSNLSNTSIISLTLLPFIHHISNNSVHAWYYSDFTQQTFNHSLYNETWYYHNRLLGSQIVSKYIHPKQEIIQEANEMWTLLTHTYTDQQVIVLGVQMRGTDKGGLGRHKVEPDAYMSYIVQFILYFHNLGYIVKIFVATDDKNYFRYIETYWNYENILDKQHKYSDIIIQQDNVIRSKFRKAVFSMDDLPAYEAGKQCLLDILLLTKCDYLIHSASAVAEAVHWNNINMHNKSIHLEYKYNRQIPIWYDVNKYQNWPKYATIIYDTSGKCNTEQFISIVNTYCYEMFSIHAVGADNCREACCADIECDTYLWCSNVTLGGTRCKRANCWIGKTEMKTCQNATGWSGGTTYNS
eukprot:31056_1